MMLSVQWTLTQNNVLITCTPLHIPSYTRRSRLGTSSWTIGRPQSTGQALLIEIN